MNEEDSMDTLRFGGNPAALGRIDQYDLMRKLGGGGFGMVYLAHDTISGMKVALKTLHPFLKNNPDEMEILRAKFLLAARLSHPNIVAPLVLHPVRDIFIPDESVRRELKLSPSDSIMVLRYAPGVTLSKWRRQFPDGIVPFDLVLEIGFQIAAALDYAHSEKIVHRDIKPGNIMVETLRADEPRGAPDGEVESIGWASRPDETPRLGGNASPNQRIRVRILDFGLAAEIRSSMSRISNEQGNTSGTRPYMAPEQWLGRRQDGRTDQYALACVLYDLLSGAPPFGGVFETGDPLIMMAAVKGETPEAIKELPPAANAALLRALAKDPKDRFPNCTAFVDAMAHGANKVHAECAEDTELVFRAERTESISPRTSFSERDGANRPGEPQGAETRSTSTLNRQRRNLIPALNSTDIRLAAALSFFGSLIVFLVGRLFVPVTESPPVSFFALLTALAFLFWWNRGRDGERWTGFFLLFRSASLVLLSLSFPFLFPSMWIWKFHPEYIMSLGFSLCLILRRGVRWAALVGAAGVCLRLCDYTCLAARVEILSSVYGHQYGNYVFSPIEVRLSFAYCAGVVLWAFGFLFRAYCRDEPHAR